MLLALLTSFSISFGRFFLSFFSPNRRGMAGGGQYAESAVKKNKYIEEWNGRREITTETFELNFKDVPKFLMCLVIFPFGVYTSVRTEFKQSGARQFQNIC